MAHRPCRRPIERILCHALVPWTLALGAVRTDASEPRFPFVRGDANANGSVDVSDGIYILQHLFDADESPPCLEAANVNGDSSLDLADPVSLFSYLFLGKRPPPQPYPDCGLPERNEESLSCEKFPPCNDYVLVGKSVPMDPSRPLEIAALCGESAPPILVSPELYEALLLLAPGEPILALRGVPGLAEYLEQSRAFAGAPSPPWTRESYESTVTITTEPDDGSSCYEFTPERLDALTALMVERGLLEAAERLKEARPPKVCAEDEHPVLLVSEKPDGTRRIYSSITELLDDRNEEIPTHVEFRSPEPPLPDPTSGPRCDWVATLKARPAAYSRKGGDRSWNLIGYDVKSTPRYTGTDQGFGRGQDGWDAIEGGGPWHELLAERTKSNCQAPPTRLSLLRDGQIRGDIGIVCGSGALLRAARCAKTTVYCEGFYVSHVEIESEVGWWCTIFGANDVEAIAQDEASFKVNDKKGFHKGLVLQNGSDVTTEISCEAGAEVGEKTEKDAGIAATAGLKFGYTESVKKDTGFKHDKLICQEILESTAPATVILSSKGNVHLNGYNSTLGHAQVKTRACGFYYVAISDEPGIDDAAGGYFIGTDTAELTRLAEQGKTFAKTRGYRGEIQWENRTDPGGWTPEGK